MSVKETEKELEQKLSKLKKLKEAFPDLEEDRDRWGTIRYFSKSANDKVTDVELRHSCGCCNDSPLYAMPYLKVDGTEVYGSPVRVCIGERCSYGDAWDSDWREKMEKNGYSEKAIATLDKYFEKAEKKREWYESEPSDWD